MSRVLERRLRRVAFIADMRLPSGVWGPRDFEPLIREASRCLSDLMRQKYTERDGWNGYVSAKRCKYTVNIGARNVTENRGKDLLATDEHRCTRIKAKSIHNY